MLLKAVGRHFSVDDIADLLERHPTPFSPVACRSKFVALDGGKAASGYTASRLRSR